MKHFVFNPKIRREVSTENNGWILKMKYLNRIGYFYLKSPITEEVTYSKGSTVRYMKHTVFGIGYVDDRFSFKGLAFFDLHVRCLIVLAILIGVSYASGKLYVGSLCAVIFYLLISFLSLTDDDCMLHNAKIMSEM